jgi:hypothetical protein
MVHRERVWKVPITKRQRNLYWHVVVFFAGVTEAVAFAYLMGVL